MIRQGATCTPLRRIAVVVLLATLPTMLAAHDSRPVHVEIKETDSEVFAVQTKIPASMPSFALPSVVMPENCVESEDRSFDALGDGYTVVQQYRCPDGVSGREVALHYPNNNPSLSALFRINLLNGEQHVRILGPSEGSWRVPEQESFWKVAGPYTWLGIQHIFEGIDHLLFVACLVFIARTFRRILITITGFTIAHSLTLALSTLEVIRLPVAPVEAVIALSIVFLAHEIAVDRRQSLTWRFPIAVSSSFGLLHGFGFASVLREVGLPQTELAAALLFFNLGVEVGQVTFVLALSALAAVAASAVGSSIGGMLEHRRLSLTSSYLMGGLASFWLVERLTAFI